MLDQVDHALPVDVVVDETEACLVSVGLAAREAARRKVPLKLVQSAEIATTHLQRAQQLQRLDRALATARRAVPRLDIRVTQNTASTLR